MRVQRIALGLLMAGGLAQGGCATVAPTPERVVSALKAWSTRRLAEAQAFAPGVSIWSRHGSTVYLWTQQSVERAVDYVVYGQGAPLG